jgi:hypothetical protein
MVESMASLIAFLLGNVWRTVALALILALGLQTLRLGWAQDARDAAIAQGAVAVEANRSQDAMLQAMIAQRDGLLLARAADKKATDAALAESNALLMIQNGQLRAAAKRIHELSRRPNCIAVMDAPICPEIAQELRAP